MSRISLLRLTTAAVAVTAALVVVVAGVSADSAKAATPSGWHIVPGAPVDQQNSNVLLGSTCANAWNCWVVGMSFPNLSSGGNPTDLFEHWNGSAWSTATTGNPPGQDLSGLFSVACVTSSDCWAVGAQKSHSGTAPDALVEHWNGSAWSSVAAPSASGYLTSVTCVDSSDCWAAGTSVTDDGQSDPLHGMLDHWNGSTWATVATPPSGQNRDQFNAITCTGATNCWAVGFAGPNGLANNFLPNIMPQVSGANAFIEHWNGTSWTVTPAPAAAGPLGTYLNSVTCVTPTRCWAVGADMGADGNPSSTLVDTWNGTSWTTVASPDPSSGGSLLTAVTCIDATDCWASGAVGQSGNNGGGGGNNNISPNPMIAVWDGLTWSVDPSPGATAFGYLNDVACSGGSGCFAVGFAATQTGKTTHIQALTEQMVRPPSANQGLFVSGSDGGVFTFGIAGFHGSMGGAHLSAPVVGVASTSDGGGYWLAASDGGVFAFGDAHFYGSMGGTHLNAPIVSIAAAPDGNGYWLVAADGGVFAFGDAHFYGSMGGTHLNEPIVSITATPDGGGYWLVGADGGVFAIGDAAYAGSLGAVHLTAPVVSMAATPDGGGYWLVGADGGVFAFGDAGYQGSAPGQGLVLAAPVVGLAVTPDGGGYWLVGADGGVYAYGDASFMGSLAGVGLVAPVTGVSAAA
jgi:hypothetical protein